MRSDAQLLDAWRQGDQAAARELFDRYFDRIYRFFATKVGDGVQDLIQETFLGCVEARDSISDPSMFRRYLFGIARRRLYRRWRDGDDKIDFGVSTVADLSPSPSRLLVQNEEQRNVLAAMQRLPVDLQIVLELFYWETMTAPEIGAVLDLAEGTVRTRLRRARELLGRELPRVARHSASDDRLEDVTRSLAVGPIVEARS